MRSVLAVLAVFVGLGVACGDEGEEELSGPASYTRQKEEYWQVFCTCSAGETEVQPVTSPCVRSYLTQSDCEEEVLDESWDALEDSAECLIKAYEDGIECLRIACGYERCLTQLQNDSERCEADARDAFMAECNE